MQGLARVMQLAAGVGREMQETLKQMNLDEVELRLRIAKWAGRLDPSILKAIAGDDYAKALYEMRTEGRQSADEEATWWEVSSDVQDGQSVDSGRGKKAKRKK